MTIRGRHGPETAHAPADEDLIRGLYAAHGQALLAYATRLTGDRQHAEDIVQETLVRAWRNAASLTPDRGSVRAWLFTVVRNIVVDRHRARQARPPEMHPGVLPDTSGGEITEDVLNSVQVLAALDHLRPDHRAVLIEVYYRDRTAAEAASILGVPVGTVKSRVYYALRSLRLALQEGSEPTGGAAR